MWKLDSSLGFLLTRTARGMKWALDEKLIEHNITATQYIVLERMWEKDGLSLTELGDRLHFDNPTMTGIIDRMERDGFLQRKRNDGDRRVVKVYLTPKGKIKQEQVGSIAEEVDNMAWEGFNQTQKKDLLKYLDRIWNKMNE